MLKIRSRDKIVQSLLKDLVATLTEAGAYFHPALQLDVRGAELSFSSRKKLNIGEKLIVLPLDCMPLLDDFNWSLDANCNLFGELAASPIAKNYQLHQQIVELLLQLYNRFDKLTAFAQNSPMIQLVDKRPLLECLLKTAHEGSFYAKLDQGLDNLIIHAFWNGRVFSDGTTGQLHLIPVMEFFDHSIFAGGFFWSESERGVRSLCHSYQPTEVLKGLFARYEIMDNLHAFVKYGFLDEKAFFVQSQPFLLQLSDNVLLEVGYQSASSNECHVQGWAPPPKYSNSLMYRAALKYLDDRVFMPFMLVPPERHMPAFDEALLAQLKEIEQRSGSSRGELASHAVMRRVKLALLDENEIVYRSIAQEAKDGQLDSKEHVTQLLKKMLGHQRRILKEFRAAVA